MKVWAASVEDNADCYLFVVFGETIQTADYVARAAYQAEVGNETSGDLEIGLTEVKPGSYHFFG